MKTSLKIEDLLHKTVFTLERQLKCSRAAWKRMAKLTGETKKGIPS